MNPRTFWILVYVVCCWIECALTGIAAAQATDPIRQIIADWEKRRAALPVVQYRMTGTRLWPRGAFNEYLDEAIPGPNRENPATDLRGKVTRTVLLDFPGNRHRIEWDDEEYGNLTFAPYRVRVTHACDGRVAYSHIHENSDPKLGVNQAKRHVDMMISRGEMWSGPFDFAYLPLFLGHGVICFDSKVRVRPGLLAPKANAADFIYRGQGQYAGRQCAILRTAKTGSFESEFWIDRERDSAVVKIINNPDSESVQGIVEIKYRETPHGWLVSGWTHLSFHDSQLHFIEKIDIQRITANPPAKESDFTIKTLPGMYIQDITDGNSSYYRIEPDGHKTVLNDRLFPDPGGDK